MWLMEKHIKERHSAALNPTAQSGGALCGVRGHGSLVKHFVGSAHLAHAELVVLGIVQSASALSARDRLF